MTAHPTASTLATLGSARLLKRADGDLLLSAGQLLAATRDQAARQQADLEAIRLEAERRGHADGVEQGKQAWAMQLAERHLASQARLQSMHGTFVTVVMASVRHLVGDMPDPVRFEALASQVLAATTRARHLRLVVSADDAEQARAVLVQWQQRHPDVASIEVVVESSLSTGDCIVETDEGAIDGRLERRLVAIEAALTQRLAAVEAGPADARGRA